MSALRFGINCSRRAATSCALLTAPRISRYHRRLSPDQSKDINQPSHDNKSLDFDQIVSKDAKLPVKVEIVNDDEILQKNSPQIIKVNGVAYPSLFLRDSCSCHRCVDSLPQSRRTFKPPTFLL
ncbi:hypothetical protein DID88_006159 [Monilinia fructigena]|uniref:Uncharacterized protein n=1 Tax=Monilinia fructigena TaxID=38457 RepID=A0A395J712_9HELO|nr:hypothetical protein DID88_006159 [Monilinia fructigena]